MRFRALLEWEESIQEGLDSGDKWTAAAESLFGRELEVTDDILCFEPNSNNPYYPLATYSPPARAGSRIVPLGWGNSGFVNFRGSDGRILNTSVDQILSRTQNIFRRAARARMDPEPEEPFESVKFRSMIEAEQVPEYFARNVLDHYRGQELTLAGPLFVYFRPLGPGGLTFPTDSKVRMEGFDYLHAVETVFVHRPLGDRWDGPYYSREIQLVLALDTPFRPKMQVMWNRYQAKYSTGGGNEPEEPLSESDHPVVSLWDRFVETYRGRTLKVIEPYGLWLRASHGKRVEVVPEGGEVLVLGWKPGSPIYVQVLWKGEAFVVYAQELIQSTHNPFQGAAGRAMDRGPIEPEEPLEESSRSLAEAATERFVVGALRTLADRGPLLVVSPFGAWAYGPSREVGVLPGTKIRIRAVEDSGYVYFREVARDDERFEMEAPGINVLACVQSPFQARAAAIRDEPNGPNEPEEPLE